MSPRGLGVGTRVWFGGGLPGGEAHGSGFGGRFAGPEKIGMRETRRSAGLLIRGLGTRGGVDACGGAGRRVFIHRAPMFTLYPIGD